MDISTLASLLREAEEHHGEYEAGSPPHHWADWYAPYIYFRDQGRSQDEARKEATEYLDRQLAEGESS